MPETPDRRDRSFAPSLVVGLAGAGLAAVAGSRQWATARGDASGIKVEASVSGAESQPLVAALAFVALASWGVLLAVRGRGRRVVAAVGVAASVGAAVSVMLAFGDVQDDAVEAVLARGATGDTSVTGLSPWYHLAGAGAALSAVALAVAVARSPRWPAMGTRYDAPAVRERAPGDDDMWRALDEGRDPTS